MAKSILAICDCEAAYADGFMDYVNQRQNIPFEVQAFRSVESLSEYIGYHSVEIVLMSDRIEHEKLGKVFCGMKVMLSEGSSKWVDDVPSVYKYQSCNAVVREVMEHYGKRLGRDGAHRQQLSKKKTKFIGVYSPIQRIRKTTLALLLGQLLSRDNAALYINLENFSGFEQLLHTRYERTFSELLYYVHQGEESISAKISGMIYQLDQLDIIPPTRTPMDIQEGRFEDYEKIFEVIEKESSYERVIVDIGEGVRDIFRVLSCMDVVFMPILEDVVSRAKLEQFTQTASGFGYKSLLENIRRIKIPFHIIKQEGEDFLENLKYSELGDFARELLRKSRL